MLILNFWHLKLRAVISSRQIAKITQCEKFAVIIIRTHVMLVLNNTHRHHVVIVIKILYI